VVIMELTRTEVRPATAVRDALQYSGPESQSTIDAATQESDGRRLGTEMHRWRSNNVSGMAAAILGLQQLP
jgi:hypothetical protein